MKTLERFISYLCGNFNNEEQVRRKVAEGDEGFPKASHINRVCHQKMVNLPTGFKGYFVIEESYYEVKGRENAMPHLFLFELNEKGKVVLTSYDLPEGMDKTELKNNNDTLVLDYHKLKPSEKFIPMVYEEVGESFEGKSVSDFGNGLVFTLEEKTSEDTLVVGEVFKKNGKHIFGFDEPIIYKKQ